MRYLRLRDLTGKKRCVPHEGARLPRVVVFTNTVYLRDMAFSNLYNELDGTDAFHTGYLQSGWAKHDQT